MFARGIAQLGLQVGQRQYQRQAIDTGRRLGLPAVLQFGGQRRRLRPAERVDQQCRQIELGLRRARVDLGGLADRLGVPMPALSVAGAALRLKATTSGLLP